MIATDILRDIVKDGLSHAGKFSPLLLNLTRVDLAHLFQAFGFTHVAEIGVEQGRYSKVLCEANPDMHLLCVDAWQAYPKYREHVTQSKLDGFYEDTLVRLRNYNVTVVKKFSVDAARDVPDGSLDAVYIDGNHGYEHVIADLQAWTPKVRAGGIISGHDYGRSSVGQVKEAVTDWTKAHQIEPWFVLTADRSPSFMWVQRG